MIEMEHLEMWWQNFTLYDVIRRSTASAPETSMFFAVVKYCVRSLTPPSLSPFSTK